MHPGLNQEESASLQLTLRQVVSLVYWEIDSLECTTNNGHPAFHSYTHLLSFRQLDANLGRLRRRLIACLHCDNSSLWYRFVGV